LGLSWPPQQSCPNRSGVCNEALGHPCRGCTLRGRATSTACGAPGEGLSVRLQAGPGRPGRAAAASGYALAPAPLRERAGRLARDTGGRVEISSGCFPGEGGADCAEPPQRPARCASRSGVNGLDSGAPTTPRPAIAGRPEACRRLPAPPSPAR